MKRMKRFVEYDGWKIEASPVILSRQRLFQAGVVIERADGERFVFSDLGNRVYRWQAYERHRMCKALDRHQLPLRRGGSPQFWNTEIDNLLPTRKQQT